MPRTKEKDALGHLGSEERSQVLTKLLSRHEDLRKEANGIADTIIGDVCVEVVAEEVAHRVGSLDIEDSVTEKRKALRVGTRPSTKQ